MRINDETTITTQDTVLSQTIDDLGRNALVGKNSAIPSIRN